MSERFGWSLAELGQRMTPREIMLRIAFDNLRGKEADQAAKKAEARRGRI